MSKFENIKPGDKVFIKESIRYGHRDYQKFWIEKTVDRITKTLFVIGKRRFKKEDGGEVGVYDWDKARFDGEILRKSYQEETVADQSEEMAAFKRQVKLVDLVNRDLYGLSKRVKVGNHTNEELGKAMELIRQLAILLSITK